MGTVAVAFSAVGAVAVTLPEVLGNGKDVTQLVFSGVLSLPLMAVIVVARPFATAACLRSGAAGGLFTLTSPSAPWRGPWPGEPGAPSSRRGRWPPLPSLARRRPRGSWRGPGLVLRRLRAEARAVLGLWELAARGDPGPCRKTSVQTLAGQGRP